MPPDKQCAGFLEESLTSATDAAAAAAVSE